LVNRSFAADCVCDIPVVMQAKYCYHCHMVARWNQRSSGVVVAMMLIIESLQELDEKKY
jgi:hypothetical protein